MAHRGRCALLAGCTNQTGPNYTRRTNSDRSHPLGSIRPGTKKTKKPKRGGSRIRPRYEKDEKAKKGWRGGLLRLFRLFRTGSVFSHPHAQTRARAGGDALPYNMLPPHNVGKAARFRHRAANVIPPPNAKSRIVRGDTPLFGVDVYVFGFELGVDDFLAAVEAGVAAQHI